MRGIIFGTGGGGVGLEDLLASWHEGCTMIQRAMLTSWPMEVSVLP